MTDSSDKKSKETLDNLDVDLDAMQDEAEFSAFSMNEFQDDEEAIDRLLMNDDFDDAAEQSNVENVSALDEFDDFSDFSDFDEPEMVLQDSPRTAAAADDESDLIQDDEVEASIPTVADLTAVNEEPQAAIAEFDEDALEALDDFSDFSDFDEPEITPAVEIEEAAPATEDLSFHGYDADLTDEADDFDEFDLIQDDEVEVLADVVEQPSDDESAVNSLVLDAAADSEDALEKTDGESDELFDDAGLSDEVDDFSSLTDDFDEFDLIQDDEVEVLADAVEQPSDDESAINSLVLDAAIDSEDALEKTDGEADELFVDAGLSDDVDDDVDDEVDDFDDSDMIQIDEVDDWADLVTTNEEPQAVVEESFDDLLGDENNTDSLLLDSGIEEEDTLEQAIGKKDEIGDDTDLIGTDSFFQLDEVGDDFSSQTEAVQLAETEISSTQDEQEDDFLLPDFDITADTEVSDVGSDAGAKEDVADDVFGNIDFLNEEEALKVFGAEAVEPKPGDNEVVVEPEPKQAPTADIVMTAVENTEDLKLSPFGFEQEDIKKQLEDAEHKVKKAKLFSYVAMGFGAVALIAAVGLGVMTYHAKSEFSKLTEVVSTLEASLAKSAENNSNIVVKQDMVSKELDVLQDKMGGLEDKASLAPSIAEPAKAEAAHELVPTKAVNASEPAKAKTGAVQGPAPSKGEASHKTTPAPAKVEAVSAKTKSQPEAVQVKEKAEPEAVQAKAKAQPEEAVAAKPKIAEKPAVKPEPVKEKKQAAPGKWGVNLGAFKQEWFAKSKAAEYAQQGVLAEVMPVHEKNVTMYRLRVMGFKTKAEADSNTAKIKKALNLDSVWVSDN
ncbi:MAG: SPOR domain-containing protein [Methylobacter sp.]|nr:SPOR domain-containing protein [Methylobacter sp.]